MSTQIVTILMTRLFRLLIEATSLPPVNRRTPLEDILGLLDEALNDKYITNPDYNMLKSALNSKVGEYCTSRQTELGKGFAFSILKDFSKYIDNIYEVDGLSGIPSLKKKIPELSKRISGMVIGSEVQPPFTPEDIRSIRAYRGPDIDLAQLRSGVLCTEDHIDLSKAILKMWSEVYAMWNPIVDKMKDLKPFIKKAGEIRQEVRHQKDNALAKKFSDSSSLVTTLMTYKEAYIEVAKKAATERVDMLLRSLEKANWDINTLLPTRGYSKNTRVGYEIFLSGNIYRGLTSPVGKADAWGKPEIRMRSKPAEEKFIKNAVDGAAASYDEFVAKMVEKIGKPVVTSSFTGDPWTGSTLRVRCSDGEEQVWNTRMIVNYSVYGKAFNQFPSRRQK